MNRQRTLTDHPMTTGYVEKQENLIKIKSARLEILKDALGLADYKKLEKIAREEIYLWKKNIMTDS